MTELEPEWCYICDDYLANCYGHSHDCDDEECDEEPFDCFYPDECLMPFPHTLDECCTVEDVENLIGVEAAADAGD